MDHSGRQPYDCPGSREAYARLIAAGRTAAHAHAGNLYVSRTKNAYSDDG